MINAFIRIRKSLALKNKIADGGSMGNSGVEWCLMNLPLSKIVLHLLHLQLKVWGIAIHTAQRLAIEADQTWKDR
jgi:homoserine O-acetyltransferase